MAANTQFSLDDFEVAAIGDDVVMITISGVREPSSKATTHQLVSMFANRSDHNLLLMDARNAIYPEPFTEWQARIRDFLRGLPGWRIAAVYRDQQAHVIDYALSIASDYNVALAAFRQRDAALAWLRDAG